MKKRLKKKKSFSAWRKEIIKMLPRANDKILKKLFREGFGYGTRPVFGREDTVYRIYLN